MTELRSNDPVHGAVLILDAEEVTVVREAVRIVMSDSATRSLTWLWTGSDESRLRAFKGFLDEWWTRTARAYQTKPLPEPPTWAVPIGYAHLIYCLLVTSTEVITSEEEYKIRTGLFRDQATGLAKAITDAISQWPPADQYMLTDTNNVAPPPEPPLQVIVFDAHIVRASLGYLLERAGNSAALDLWLGINTLAGRKIVTTLSERITLAEGAVARHLPIEIAEAHVAYSALVFAARIAASEEEYYTKVGFFTENAHKAASNIRRELLGLPGSHRFRKGNT